MALMLVGFFAARGGVIPQGYTRATSFLIVNIFLTATIFQSFCVGGDLSPDGLFTHGEDALRQLERYQTDWAMLSVDSVSAAEGVSLCHPEECMVSRRMLERAARGVIVADHTKIRRAGFVHICDAAAPLMLVTSRLADADETSALRAAGMEVVLT